MRLAFNLSFSMIGIKLHWNITQHIKILNNHLLIIASLLGLALKNKQLSINTFFKNKN
jgi:hypothetical protein